MDNSLAYRNGQWLPRSNLNIALDDLGFLWGATVVDRVRTYRRQWHGLSDHIERFLSNCHQARIPVPLDAAAWRDIADRLLQENGPLLPPGGELCLILLATPGESTRSGHLPLSQPAHQSTLIAYTDSLPLARYAAQVVRGAKLLVAKMPHLSLAQGLRTIKHRSRLFWWLAEQQVRDIDAEAQALLLDEAGHLTETATSNLILVIDGVLHTPPAGHVLPGISIAWLKAWAAKCGIPFQETLLRVEHLTRASEAMISSTPFGFAPVRQIDNQSFPVPGPLFQQLHQTWCQQLGYDPHAAFRAALPGRSQL